MNHTSKKTKNFYITIHMAINCMSIIICQHLILVKCIDCILHGATFNTKLFSWLVERYNKRIFCSKILYVRKIQVVAQVLELDDSQVLFHTKRMENFMNEANSIKSLHVKIKQKNDIAVITFRTPNSAKVKYIFELYMYVH